MVGKKIREIEKGSDKIEVITVSEKTKNLNVKEINKFILDIMNNLKYLVNNVNEPELLKVKLPKLSLLHSYNDDIIKQYTTDIKKKNIFGFKTSETVESAIRVILEKDDPTINFKQFESIFIKRYNTDIFKYIIKIVYNIQNLNRDILKEKYNFLMTKIDDEIYKKIKHKLNVNYDNVGDFITAYHEYFFSGERNRMD